MESLPLVSVVIPTIQGRERKLKRALRSVEKQTYPNIEIIVVKEGLPATTQRNIGIDRSTGEFIAFLDDDDEWHYNKIMNQVNYLIARPSIAGCVTYMLDLRRKPYRISKPKDIITHADLVKGFNLSSTSSHMYRRVALEVLKQMDGYYFDESLPTGQEYDLSLRITRHHDIGTIPHLLAVQHPSDDSISTNWNNKVRSQFLFIEKWGWEYSAIDYLKRIGLAGLFWLGNIFGDRIMKPINWSKDRHDA